MDCALINSGCASKPFPLYACTDVVYTKGWIITIPGRINILTLAKSASITLATSFFVNHSRFTTLGAEIAEKHLSCLLRNVAIALFIRQVASTEILIQGLSNTIRK